jgi:predicted metal-binding membrane protein
VIFAARTAHDQRWYRAALACLILGAWLALWLWGESPHTGVFGHQRSGEPAHTFAQHVAGLHQAGRPAGDPQGVAGLTAFAAAWTLMTVAMMLPSSLPLVNLFQRMVSIRPNRHRLMLTLGAGYLGTWVVVGIIGYAAGLALYHLVGRAPVLEASGWIVVPTLFLLAGIYQFTPLKHMCLEKCRSPYAFLVEHWHGRRAAGDALRLGIRHGLFCVGCCWTLMLLMFAAGTAHLAWMLALGAVMTAERTTRWGRIVAPAVGVALILSGLLAVAQRIGVSAIWIRALGLG